jgi:hypothetical protein
MKPALSSHTKTGLKSHGDEQRRRKLGMAR